MTTTTAEEEQPGAPAVGGPPVAPGGGPAPMGCANELSNSPMCRFAGICECEEFVNAPESEGCGGMYKSDFGDVPINDVCALYCGDCKDIPLEEVFEEAYMEVMTIQMHEKCRYATAECQSMLSNLYSCASGQPGIEAAHPMIQAVVTKRGQEVAMSSAQLGASSLHAGEEPQEIQACAPDTEAQPEGKNGEVEDTTSAAAGCALFSSVFALLIFVSTSMLL